MLEVRGVGKRYGATQALQDVSIDFRPGEIHAVLGENGAGKSTLMGIMSGFVAPSAGKVDLDGKPIPLGRAFDCKRRGIEMIHQHFTLVPDFTVAENLALARLDGLGETARVEARARPSLEAAKRLGWEIDPEARVRNLPVGAQQRLEILKALGGDARVLILDEPTAVLSPDEVEDLFRVLRSLRAEGRIVILIAHKLSEVFSVADRVTVLRRGRFVASAEIGAVDARQLADWMVGELPAALESRTAVGQGEGLTVTNLEVVGDRGERSVRGVSFAIAGGEIFGVGGVDGNGQIELAEAVAGVRSSTGEMRWRGSLATPESPRIGYVPQDRQADGLAVSMTVEENMLVGNDARPTLSRGSRLAMAAIRRWSQSLIVKFEIRTPGPLEMVANLSGGNQQKVVVSRTLDSDPELLVVVNPTRGLDIRAAGFVHECLRNARARGAAILLISTDLDELAALADRTQYLSRGSLGDALIAVEAAP